MLQVYEGRLEVELKSRMGFSRTFREAVALKSPLPEFRLFPASESFPGLLALR